jgi:hypothetical protein
MIIFFCLIIINYYLDSFKLYDDHQEQLKWAINGIDIVGCELTQNISKILKEK